VTIEKRQLAFGDELRKLREEAGFPTGKLFAERLGWLPSKVSRIENGRTIPSDSDVIVWVDAVDVSEAVAAHLRDQLRDIRLARSSWKRRLRAGHESVQHEYAAHEQAAKRIVVVEFYVVPGVAQTAEYARAVFLIGAAEVGSPQDTEAAVLARIQRQGILYDPTKKIEILIAESALLYPICSPSVMRGQIDRLTSLLGLPSVRIGIIPLGTRLPVVTMHGYSIMDDEVAVEINHTEVVVTDPEDIALYERITENLWSVAVEGDEARGVLGRIASQLAE
jgi:transcriptional regulator with XRE-family HTH domain